jgi:hypothetical protein
MATVKFSKDLRDRIVNTASCQFNPAIQAATASSPKDWGNKLYDLAFDQYQERMDALPAGFFATRDSLCIASITNDQNRIVNVGITFALGGPKRFPYAIPQDCMLRARSYGDQLDLIDCPEVEEFKNEVCAWRKRIEVAEQQQQELKRHVRAVIDSFATLAPALKAWEPLWTFIPEDIREKHKLIVEREVKEVTINTDLDRATALASLAKLRQQ